MSAAPMDGLSLSDEASLSQLRQRLQRDLNCLSDPDRSTRKRALTKLQKTLFREAKVERPLEGDNWLTFRTPVFTRGELTRSCCSDQVCSCCCRSSLQR